jgi:sensor domain CHASE-containing protein
VSTDTQIALLALIVSVVSLALSFLASGRDRYLKNAQLRTELLTKISSLRIEYERLLHEVERSLKHMEYATPELQARFESQRNHVREFLSLTDEHYRRLMEAKDNVLKPETLEKMGHHVEALMLRTDRDREKYEDLNRELGVDNQQ